MAYRPDIEVYSPSNVFNALGVRYKGGQKNECVKCPECGKNNFYMEMTQGIGHCMSASCNFRANHTSYYAHMKGYSDLNDARRDMYEYMGEEWKGPKNKNKKTTTAPKVSHKYEKTEIGTEAESVPIEVKNETYKKVVKSHPLINRHINDLKKRGLTKKEISSLEYCSFGYSDETALGEKYTNEGYTLEGVPGFYKENGIWQLRTLKKGILFPYKDSKNRIQGFQLRKNNEELKTFIEKGKKKKEKKCNWLSSSGLEGGCAASGYIHYACDFAFDFHKKEYVPLIKNGTVLLTEGGMKADIIHIIEGSSVIAIPGVNNFNALKKELKVLKSLGVTKIIDTLDMDYLTNPNVYLARETIKNLICEEGISYELKTWDIKAENHADLKGYDDYLAYHVRGV